MSRLHAKRMVYVFLAAAMLATGTFMRAFAAGTAEYPDVSAEAWYSAAVGYCTDAGLMGGTGGAQFHPELSATRAMAATALYRLEGKPGMGNGKSGTFVDVPESVWYTDAVEWTAAREVAMGYGNGSFGPDDGISREQLVTMLYRYAEYKGWNVSVPEGTDVSVFTDASDISGYAASAVQWAAADGILTGRAAGALAPRQTATRAELAAVLARFATQFSAGTEE